MPFLYYCAQVVSQSGTERDLVPHGHREGSAKRQRVSLQAPDRGAREQFERHHRAHRIAGQADPGHAGQQSEPHRRAGAHRDAPQLQLAAQILEHLAHQVVLADAHPARRDEQIGAGRAAQVLAQAFLAVARDAEVPGLGAGAPDQRIERVGVRARDLLSREDLLFLIEIGDLVAGTHERDARRAVHERRIARNRREHAELRRTER